VTTNWPGFGRLSTTRKLALVPAIFLVAIAGILFYTILTVEQQKHDAVQVEIGARQRMLAQSLLMEVLLSVEGVEADFDKTMQQLRSDATALLNGGQVESSARDGSLVDLPKPPNEEIAASLAEQVRIVGKLEGAVAAFVAAERGTPAYRKALDGLVALGGELRDVSNRTVLMLTESSSRRIEAMIRWEVASGVIVGLLGILLTVQVRRANQELEAQVAERQQAEAQLDALVVDLRGKVDALLDVVSQAASGDLTGEVPVAGEEAIGKLGNGLQRMLDNLRHLVEKVQQSGIKVASATTDIAATAKQQEATATEQAATTMEIVATARQISATSKELVNTMDEVAAVSEATAQLATEGHGGVERMQVAITRMSEATTSVGSRLTVLSEKAGNIGSVVTTITKIADQTNLLSLNAAIEAEKAGEYGRGFSVVATEIRRLADQTAVATLDIEQMVKDIQLAVSAGVMSMDKFQGEVRRSVEDVRQVGHQLTRIIEQVQTLTPRFEMVLEGVQSQSQGAEQITEAMSQLAETAQQTADSLRQSSSAVAQLTDAARNLQTAVQQFRVKE
jgi:methyl-accepting chemotaxis protein